MGQHWFKDRMTTVTTPPHVQTERSTTGRERRQVQQREREQDDSQKTGVPDLQQQSKDCCTSVF
eukprot:1140228-Pelagomonas_calceolata.AAC.1